jgi:outer membrane autotransporter protein
MSGVITALNGLNSSAQSNAISQTLPALTGATSKALLNVQQGFNQVIQARQNNTSGMSSGEDFIATQNMWLKGYGSWATQHEQSGVAGYSVNTGGLALGGDTQLSPRATLGVAFAFNNSSIKSGNDNAPSSVNVNGYQAGMYGDYAINPRLNWSYQLDAGFSNNKANRSLSNFAGVFGVTGTNANANFNATSVHFGTGLRHRWDLNDKTAVIPSVRLDYTGIQTKGYTESGAGVLNLNVGSQTSQALYLLANLRLDRELTERIKVSTNIGAGYNTLNNQVQLTAAYQGGGPVFVTNGLTSSPWLYNAGLGVTGQLARSTELSLRYDLQTSPTGYTNNMASAKLKIVY